MEEEPAGPPTGPADRTADWSNKHQLSYAIKTQLKTAIPTASLADVDNVGSFGFLEPQNYLNVRLGVEEFVTDCVQFLRITAQLGGDQHWPAWAWDFETFVLTKHHSPVQPGGRLYSISSLVQLKLYRISRAGLDFIDVTPPPSYDSRGS